MPSKLLFRTSPPSEGSPPWTSIAFLHPIDSDELAEDLKRTYPDGRTLRERKHMAIIDFFTDELRQMQHARGAVSPAAISRLPVYAPVPPAVHRGLDDRIPRTSQSPASSTCSVVPVDPPVQAGTLGVVGRPAEAVGVGAQQFVFSAADGKTMQAKTKRKMTVDEKTAYKETRRRGACSKCKRQKGKCTHRFDDATGGEVQVVVEENGKRPASVEIDTERDRKVVKIEHPADADTKVLPPRGSEFTVVNRAEVMASNQPQRYVPRTSLENPRQSHAELENNPGLPQTPGFEFDTGQIDNDPSLSSFSTDASMETLFQDLFPGNDQEIWSPHIVYLDL